MSYYIIIDTEQLNNIDFAEVEQNKDTARRSADGTKTILSYQKTQPESIFSQITLDRIGLKEYTSKEILTEIKKPFWRNE